MNGFTIIELLIATAVFSLVLLGALGGFLRTGNLFYKGVTLTQTQAAAKQLMDDVTASIGNANSAPAYNQGGYLYYCIGNVRYAYTNNVVNTASPNYNGSDSGNFGVIKTSAGNCQQPPTIASLSGSAATEMLSDNMQLGEFLVCPASTGSQLYNINISIIYSNTKLSGASTPTCTSPSYTPPECTGSTQSQQFCSVSNLSTSVYAGTGL